MTPSEPSTRSRTMSVDVAVNLPDVATGDGEDTNEPAADGDDAISDEGLCSGQISAGTEPTAKRSS